MSPEIKAFQEYATQVHFQLKKLHPQLGVKGVTFTKKCKSLIRQCTARGRALYVSDREISDLLGISKSGVGRICGLRTVPTYFNHHRKDRKVADVEKTLPQLTTKAKLCIEVARSILPPNATGEEIEAKATALMAHSEHRLQELLARRQPPNGHNGVLKLTTRAGFTIEGMTFEQVMELVKQQ